MAATIPHIETITFTDWFLAIIDTPDIPIDEIEIRVAEGFKRKLTERQFQQLTELIHLISFIKHKKISNPTLALRIYVDENTSSLSRTALVEAVRMLPPEDNKTYELAAYLAQKNKLERYTNITKVPPLQIYQGDGVFEQYDEWILLFELFGLTQATPSDFIPAIAHLLITKNLGIPDLRALSKFMSTTHKLGILSQSFMNNMTPHLCNGQIIEKYESLLLKLQINDLLTEEILEVIYPLLNQPDALDAFFHSIMKNHRTTALCLS